MKDPYILKRTHLNIKQAKLMGNLAKNKLSRDKFMYMLNYVDKTKEREYINELLIPKNIKRSDSKLSQNKGDQAFLDPGNHEVDIDLSQEVKKVIQEYGNVQKVHVKRKTTTNNLAYYAAESSNFLKINQKRKIVRNNTKQFGSLLAGTAL